MMTGWFSANFIELFGAVTGIAYVILEIRRNIWLWPLGIITSAVYMYVFASNGFYANMGLQGYYLVISVYGWYAWRAEKARVIMIERSSSAVAEPGNPPSALPGENSGNIEGSSANGRVTDVRRIDTTTAMISLVSALVLWGLLWYVIGRWTDSTVPVWDGLIASLSVVATWMLTRKYLEQWYVWIVANAIAVAVYLAAGLYPTTVLFFVYFVMAIIGLREWARVRVGGSRGSRQ